MLSSREGDKASTRAVEAVAAEAELALADAVIAARVGVAVRAVVRRPPCHPPILSIPQGRPGGMRRRIPRPTRMHCRPSPL